MPENIFIHASADVSPDAVLGEGTKIWHHCQIREGVIIGKECILGKDVYVDSGVTIGNRVKIQNGVSIYQGVTLEDGVFCGPHCIFTNDLHPRSVNADGKLRTSRDWTLTKTLVRYGASIGAGAVIVCGIKVGNWAMVGAGAVVVDDVPDYGLVYGNPAKLKGFVCPCGKKLATPGNYEISDPVLLVCQKCKQQVIIPRSIVASVS